MGVSYPQRQLVIGSSQWRYWLPIQTLKSDVKCWQQTSENQHVAILQKSLVSRTDGCPGEGGSSSICFKACLVRLNVISKNSQGVKNVKLATLYRWSCCWELLFPSNSSTLLSFIVFFCWFWFLSLIIIVVKRKAATWSLVYLWGYLTFR